MYRALIVEDDPQAAETLHAHLERYAAERGASFSVEILPSALEFLEGTHPADVIFMDIGLPGVSGMEAAEVMRQTDELTPLIFVTDLAQYAVRGYQVDAVDFVVKPVEYGNFSQRMDRAMRVVARNSARSLALPTENGLRVVAQSELVYVDMSKHDVCYHLTDGTCLKERGSLRAAEERLGTASFVRVSSGCLANMGRVARIGRESIVMEDGTELFFSRSQRKRALEALANYVGRSI